MPSLHEVVAIIINSQDVPVTWGYGEMCVLAKCLCYKALKFIVSLAPSKAIFFQTCLLELQFLDFMPLWPIVLWLAEGFTHQKWHLNTSPSLHVSQDEAQVTQPTASSVVYVAVSFQNSKSSHFVCFMFHAKGGPGSEDEKKKKKRVKVNKSSEKSNLI